MRTFFRKIHSSKIENVGFEPRLCVPGAACCHYTTFSMTIPTGCCVPFGTRSATTEPVGETEPVPPERQSGVLTAILWDYTGFYKGRQANTGPPFCKTVRLLFDSLLFDSGESPGYPHLRAGVSTTTMSSMVTSKIAANITKLSIVGMDVPWIHL